MSDPLHGQRRAARRALAKQHHPDRGGDPADFVRAMASVEPPVTPRATPAPRPDIVVTVSLRSRARRTVVTTRRTLVAQVRRVPWSTPWSKPGPSRVDRI